MATELLEFTVEQYKQILAILNDSNKSQIRYSKFFKEDIWIIDTGASDHMTFNKSSLSSMNSFYKPFLVNLPNDNSVDVTTIANVCLSDHLKLHDVFFIPSFKVNLLLVSKITKTLKCSVTFFPNFCIFQDLAMRKTIGLGREQGGLYIICPKYNRK